jgi:hypothetical protein
LSQKRARRGATNPFGAARDKNPRHWLSLSNRSDSRKLLGIKTPAKV